MRLDRNGNRAPVRNLGRHGIYLDMKVYDPNRAPLTGKAEWREPRNTT